MLQKGEQAMNTIVSEAAAPMVTPVLLPIVLFTDAIVIFLTVFFVMKLKNKQGIKICWIPSFIAFAVMIVLIFVDAGIERFADLHHSLFVLLFSFCLILYPTRLR